MLQALVQIIGLLALWLIMSGIYKSLIIGFGVISSILCVWIIFRLGLVDDKLILQRFRFVSGLKYLAWLTVEIGKADWAVSKVILASVMPNQQRFIGVPAKQKSDIAKVLYANSITMTPGTVTVETEGEHLIVHSLTDEAADMAALEDMGDRVCAIERPERNIKRTNMRTR